MPWLPSRSAASDSALSILTANSNKTFPMAATPATRPKTFEEFAARRVGMGTAEGIQRALAFKPRPDDVIITPYGKCGTTWLQQVFHGLRTRGDMDFDDISRVVPWIET